MGEIFAPFREHTEQISETEIDQLVKKAEVKLRQSKKRKPENQHSNFMAHIEAYKNNV